MYGVKVNETLHNNNKIQYLWRNIIIATNILSNNKP